MPETPFFDQAAPGAGKTRTAPDRLEGTVALVTGEIGRASCRERV